MRKILMLSAMAVLTSVIFGQNVISVSVDDNKLTIGAGDDFILFQACSENILQVDYMPLGIMGEDTLVVFKTDWDFNGYNIDTSSNPVVLSTSSYRIEIFREPFSFDLYNSEGEKIHEIEAGNFAAEGIISNVNPGTYYGVYNRAQPPLELTGWAPVGAWSQGGAGGPFVWSLNGWGFLADEDGGYLNAGTDEFIFGRDTNGVKEDFEFYFFIGKPEDIFSGWTEVSGRAPLLPKYLLGFINTEWGIDEDELKNDAETYRNLDIPIDCYVLDFDWMDWGADNFGEFRWGNKFSSAHGGGLKTIMDERGIKLGGIRKPRIHVNTVQGQYCETHNFFLGYEIDYFSGEQVGLLNFHDPECRQWYWESFINQNSYNTGITGYWNDEADVYGGNMMFMQMQRMNYEGQRSYNNNRVWSLNRNFYSGSQRYSYIHWSGDISTGFYSMAQQRTIMLSSILLGSAWWSMDTGGFNGHPGSENYYRWIQFAAFVPVMRVHGTENQEREPWNYGDQALEISREYIKLRYSLLPYFYTMARENHETGKPPVRPFIMDYPQDTGFENYIDGWMFGDNFAVYPVVQQGAEEIIIRLPEGEWTDYFREETVSGPVTIQYPLTDHNIPLFVKSGSVFPMAVTGRYTDDPETSDRLRIVCYPGATSEFEFYEDDGVTYNYETGIWSKTALSRSTSGYIITLNIGDRNGNFNPASRDYIGEFRMIEEIPDSVLLDGQQLIMTNPDTLLNSQITGWAYDAGKKIAYARFPDNGVSSKVEVYQQVDSVPPSADSAKFTDGNHISIFFSEKVESGDGTTGAENISNYSVSDLTVIGAELRTGGMEVLLEVTDAEDTHEYELTISGIADVSPSQNIMSAKTLNLTFIEILYYTINLQQGLDGYTGCADAHIIEHSPDNNAGGFGYLETCRYSGDINSDDKSALLKFDMSEVNNSVDEIMEAELVLTLAGIRNGAPDKQISAYRLTADWSQGNNSAGIDGGAAVAGEVTWNSAFHNQISWNNPGGDFTPELLDAQIVGSETGGIYSWDISDAVLFWKENPDENFGIILKEDLPSGSSGTKVFGASENEDISLRPKIVVHMKAIPSGVEGEQHPGLLPEKFALSQNYPNPFNPSTRINYSVPEFSRVKITIYDIMGRKVKTLLDEEKSAGNYSLDWDASNLSSGVYIYRMRAGNFSTGRKCMLLK